MCRIDIGEDRLDKRPNFGLSALAGEAELAAFLDVMEWVLEEAGAVGSADDPKR